MEASADNGTSHDVKHVFAITIITITNTITMTVTITITITIIITTSINITILLLCMFDTLLRRRVCTQWDSSS